MSSWFTVSYVVREALLSMLVRLMDDETSSHYIFSFMLLLIPFLVIGFSIKANIYNICTKLVLASSKINEILEINLQKFSPHVPCRWNFS